MKSKIIILALSAGLFFSCNKSKLDPSPQSDLPDTEAFATAARAAQQVNGMYVLLKSSFFFGSRFVVYGDVRGEDFLNRTNNGVTGLQTWNFSATPATNEVQYVWRDAYACINQCNIVLARVDEAPVTDVLKNQYKGEARLLRALSYWGLLTLYAKPYADGNGASPGVPLRLTAEYSTGNNSMTRATVAQVYTQILADLNFAETNLPLNNGGAEMNTTHAHRNTAIALKTRMLLAMQRWADVITDADKLVPATAPFQAATGVGHRLEANIASVFAAPYTTLESIFSMPFTTLDLPGTQNGLANYYMPGPVGALDYTLNTAAAGIVSSTSWKATDARRAFVGTSGTSTVWRKFPSNPHTDYAPVIRYAEVLLNLAEARVRQTNAVDARAIELLNAVHRRSDNTTTYVAGDFADAAALLAQIAIERRIEFLGEGLRNFDIMRTMQAFPAKGTAPVVPANASVYIWPIPQSELFSNPDAAQNPGY
ncbi:MAG: RagB/SusD family nutrient uptake outer membrane protein [Chitinophagaceae bacterium]|nr:RagB/SusD family nutrient uptake outer membrane protein [Chitinophagaceae bacterium]